MFLVLTYRLSFLQTLSILSKTGWNIESEEDITAKWGHLWKCFTVVVCLGVRYLGALVQEGVPQRQQDVAGQTLHKNHQEPVEGDERHVDAVILKVSRQPGKLLRQEVLQHPLVRLNTQKPSINNTNQSMKMISGSGCFYFWYWNVSESLSSRAQISSLMMLLCQQEKDGK